MPRRTYIDRIDHIARYTTLYPGGLVPWLRRAAHPTLATAWRAMPSGGWMLWLASLNVEAGSPEHRALVRAAVACVRAETPDPAPDVAIAALDAADAWTAGTGTLDAVWRAVRAADDAVATLIGQRRYAESHFALDATHAAWTARDAYVVACLANDFDDERFAGLVRQHIRRTPRLPRD